MYLVGFTDIFDDPKIVLIIGTLFVIISQIKINVTNAYAGSLAWSNFFSRLTHNHPGRVVWLIFKCSDRSSFNGVKCICYFRINIRIIF